MKEGVKLTTNILSLQCNTAGVEIRSCREFITFTNKNNRFEQISNVLSFPYFNADMVGQIE